MTPESPAPESAPSEGSSLPPHFQMTIALADGSPAAMVIFGTPDGGIQFGFDRQIDHKLFGPQQIVEAMAHLNFLTKTLNKYVTDRIAEAKATLEKETQPELPLDTKSDGVPAEAEACQADACCGGRCDGEVAPHAGQPE